MNVRFFDPVRNYRKIKPEIDAAMQDVLGRGDLILRRDVEEFEQKLAEYVGTKYAVSVASGTDALILSFKAAGINPGDKVLAPSYTFRATVEAIHHVGAIPVVYDLDLECENGSVFDCRDAKAIVVAHIAGEYMPGTEKLLALAHELGIPLIEDAAQAIGAAPIRGKAATYSFYPAKVLGSYGDGGAVCTNDEAFAREIRILRNHAKDGDWAPYAYNSRLDNLLAAVLNVKMKYLPDDIERRRQIATVYDANLRGLHLQLPAPRDVYQDYIVELYSEDERDGLYEFLKKNGIETLKNGYPFPAALTKGPKTQAYEARSLRIPCNPDLTNEEVLYVVEKTNEFTDV